MNTSYHPQLLSLIKKRDRKKEDTLVRKVAHTDAIKWITEIEKIPTGKCLCPRFLKPFHLVTIGLAVKKERWQRLQLPENLEKYAARMKLWESVDLPPPCRVSERSQSGKFLPVQTFNQNKRDVHNVADELAKIVIETTSKEYQESLSNCLEELVNNFFDHANAASELPCLIAAQSWPAGNLIQIAIADAGIGIRNSLNENADLTARLLQGNACEIASQYSVTGKPNNNHSGYGLTLAKDLMKQSDGTFILLSGRELFACRGGQEISTSLNSQWPGTLLVLEWKINVGLDSLSVYNSWPKSAGFNSDDYL